MARILITGGAGFIGSHTSLLLLKRGFKITVLDSLVNSNLEVIKRVRDLSNADSENLDFIKGDILDEKLLNDLFEAYKSKGDPICSVIHFAALKSVADSVRFPLKYWDVNLSGTISLLRVMDKYSCRTIVFSSSATIYGYSHNFLKDENHPINPINPYGYSKATIETILRNLYDSNPSKWRIANLRYFNPIGAHESGLIGEDPIGSPSNIFPLLCRFVNNSNNKFKVFGRDWETKDGTCIRDYIHVMDVADGHLLMLEHLIDGKPKIVNLNLGTGKGTSVLELLNTFEKENNLNIPFIFAPRREGDVAICVADNSLMKSLLNWSPKRNLKEMCIDGCLWARNNPYGYKK